MTKKKVKLVKKIKKLDKVDKTGKVPAKSKKAKKPKVRTETIYETLSLIASEAKEAEYLEEQKQLLFKASQQASTWQILVEETAHDIERTLLTKERQVVSADRPVTDLYFGLEQNLASTLTATYKSSYAFEGADLRDANSFWDRYHDVQESATANFEFLLTEEFAKVKQYDSAVQVALVCQSDFLGTGGHCINGEGIRVPNITENDRESEDFKKLDSLLMSGSLVDEAYVTLFKDDPFKLIAIFSMTLEFVYVQAPSTGTDSGIEDAHVPEHDDNG